MPVLEPKQRALKRKKLRHAEYYDMQGIFDKLYADSKRGENFHSLMEIIGNKENILLAYRNIKRNGGSTTPGTDKTTILDISKMKQNELVGKIQSQLANYRPKPVKRVEIPKDSGKTRPLGIPCIEDRLVQQCILQALEPICEAKFNEHSYGFRPNRSAEQAIADCMKKVNRQNLYYVVDVDISGFFDNVDHTKLVKQMWTMGIRDKRLICVIRKMLKAPILMPNGKMEIPVKGTPQGGLCSPLLSNVVLNELDWWISSQWETLDTQNKYTTRQNYNGSLNKSHTYRALRGTKLKEVHIVRYADDFRIFCRTRDAAKRIYIATQNWLNERLKLSINTDKSKIVNLKRANSNFLGFRFKAVKKGRKRVANTHISDKAMKSVTKKLKDQIKKIQKPPIGFDGKEIWKFNGMVIGTHNYYEIATHITRDCARIGRIIDTSIKNRLKTRVKKHGRLDSKGFIHEKYGKSQQMRFVSEQPLVPIAYIRTRFPMCKAFKVNQYTPEGRESIHSNLKINMAVTKYLVHKTSYSKCGTMEYEDNRISRYYGQYGKCAITGAELGFEDWHCHHIIPRNLGGGDNYQNLILITEDVHRLIHAENTDTIVKYMKILNPDTSMLKKINKLRAKAELKAIHL
jgi:group II intron reverse transcriptase/maturase